MCSKLKSLLILVVLFCLISFLLPVGSTTSESTIALKLAEIEDVMDLAYASTLEAEQAGANVSGLLARLNLGCEYLAEANVWYRLEDYENASHSLDLCLDVIEDVNEKASVLRDEGRSRGENDFVVTIFASIGGVIAIVLVGFVVWRIFRRHYMERVLRLKPEVNVDES